MASCVYCNKLDVITALTSNGYLFLKDFMDQVFPQHNNICLSLKPYTWSWKALQCPSLSGHEKQSEGGGKQAKA